jgi:hypothetical protein
MMKQIRRILTILCAAVMMVCTGTKVKAAYNYKVTVLAGLHGTINGGDKIEVEYSPNKQWNQNDFLGKVTVDMETRADGSQYQKYYLRGFHVSGNEDIVGTKDITEDTVFVASYGVAGQIVKYTVYYVDAAGNTLHEKEEFYGNVGDKAVVSFQYVEGYVPNAYNMAKSLSATESENVFTFIYRPGQAVPGGGGGTTGTGGYTYIDGGTEVVYLPGTGGGGNANANAGGNQNGVNPNNAAPANQQNANAADNNAGQDAAQPADQGPAEMIDLDDTDVPLANVTSPSPDAQVTPVNPQSPLNGFWIAALLASGLGILALIAILIMLLRRKRKEHFQG